MPSFPRGTCSFVLATFALSLPARAQCGDEVVLEYLAAGPSAPVLRTPKGAPVIGGDFAFRIERGAPGVIGVVVYAGVENPVFDPGLAATVWIQPPWFAKFFLTNAQGSSSLQFNTPVVSDDLCGVQATFQSFLFDASAPTGLTVSNAVRMRVGGVSKPLFPVHAALATSGPETTGDTAVGDLDEDGLRDLVSVSATEAALWVRLGLVGGGFALPQASALAEASTSVELVDIDGDTHLDVVRTIASGVAVSLGDGVGGFLSHTRFPGVASGPVATAVADLDEDGELDLALANSLGASVIVLLGDGLGDFGSPTAYFAASGPSLVDVEAGDLDDDGHQDLVAAGASGNRISVLEGFGDGTLASPVTYAAANAPRSLEILDLDGDTLLDVAVALGSTDRVAVRLGNGNLTLDAPTLYDVGNEPRELEAADVDGDTVVDLLAYCGLTQDVSVLLGVGDGSFTQRPCIGTFASASALEPTDVDLDGILDLLVSVPSGIRTVLGVGDGTFAGTERYPMGRDLMTIGDLDGDGENDIITSPASTHLAVLLHQEDGSFAETDSLPVNPSGFSDLKIADLNGDGKADLVVTGGPPQVYLGNGDGTFVLLPNAIPVGGGGEFVLADFDGDHVLDYAGHVSNAIKVAMGNGDGTFVAGASLYGGPTGDFIPTDFTAGDMNGDTFVDLVVVLILEFTGSGGAVVRLGNGDGTFGGTIAFASNVTSEFVFGEVADPNRDGDLDVLVRLGDSVRYYRNDGVGGFTLAQSIVADTTGLQVADMEGDGRMDLVMLDFAVSDDGSTQAQIFPWLDTDQFGAPVRHTVGADAVRFAVADLDVDGIPDIAAIDHSIPAGRLSILYNQVGEE